MTASNHSRFRVLCIMVVFFAAALLTAGSVARPKTPSSGKRMPHSRAKLVIMLSTGLEDRREMAMSLEDAKAAKTSGYLSDVIWIARGRGVDALVDLLERPPEIAQLAKDAKASGVRLIACSAPLTQYGSSLDPKPDEIVTNGAVRVAELLSEGYEVIRY
jgi:hypothetical protein